MLYRFVILQTVFALAAVAQSAVAPSVPVTYFLGRDGNPPLVGPDGPLIIPKGIAVGIGDDIWVAGEAFGNTLPVVNALREENATDTRCVGRRGCPDIFLARLDDDGERATFSTYFGGSDEETLIGLGLENGNAYLLGRTESLDFPFAPEPAEPFFQHANFVVKIRARGELVYSTALPRSLTPMAIAVDQDGSAYVGGTVSGPVETIGGLGFEPDRAPLLRSDDGGETWTFRNQGLEYDPAEYRFTDFVAAGTNTDVRVYVGPHFRSSDRGESWATTNTPWRGNFERELNMAVDPTQPDRLLLAHDCELSVSLDGGDTWTSLPLNEPEGGCTTHVALAASQPGTIYAGGYLSQGNSSWFSRSDDAGVSWAALPLPQVEPPFSIEDLSVDPTDPDTLYAVLTMPGMIHELPDALLLRSDNGGQNWHQIFEQTYRTPLVDPAQPTNLYMVTGRPASTRIYRSFDRGGTWAFSELPEDPQSDVRDIASSTGTLYVTTSEGRLFRSTDQGETWSPLPDPPVGVSHIAIDPVQPLTIYAFRPDLPEQAFLLKLSEDGSRIEFLTLLGGNGYDSVHDLAIGDDGRIYVAGLTSAPDFPVTDPLSTKRPGLHTDAFFAIVNPQGDVLEFSTLVGGSRDEDTPRVALRPDGTVVLAGSTVSGDFPPPSPFAPLPATLNRVWVAGIKPGQNGFAFVEALNQGEIRGGTIALATDQADMTYVAGTQSFPDANGLNVETRFLMRLDEQGRITNLDPIAADVLNTRTPGRVAAAATSASGILNFTPPPRHGHKHAVAVSVIDYTAGKGAAEEPQVRAIVNAADQRGHPATPGAVVTIYGVNLAPEPVTAQIVDGEIPTQLGTVRVLFGEQPAPLLYASEGQINAITPGNLGEDPFVPIRVERDGVLSNTFTLTTHTASPGVFIAGPEPRPHALAVNAADGTINSPENPAPPGSAVTIYATGVGTFSPQPADGEIVSVQPPFPTAPSIAEIVLDRASFTPIVAPITYAGAAPGIVAGVAQINFTIPSNTRAGTLSLILEADNGDISPETLIEVGP